MRRVHIGSYLLALLLTKRFMSGGEFYLVIC